MPVQAPRHSVPVIRRRAALLVPLLVAGLAAGCAQPEPPPDFRPLSYAYLTKLRLMVATVDVDNAWTPHTVPGATHVEQLSPVQPVDALRSMAQDRLIPSGASGHAVFVIDDASLVQTAERFEGSLQVHVDLSAAEGTQSGYAEAHVSRTRTIVDNSVTGTRVALYELTKQMMTDMNVELEFQVRRSLRDYLQGPTQAAPPPAPVEQQDLSQPPANPTP